MTSDELRTMRHAAGWTQTELAILLDVNPRTVRRWESGDQKIAATVAFMIRGLAIRQGRKKAIEK